MSGRRFSLLSHGLGVFALVVGCATVVPTQAVSAADAPKNAVTFAVTGDGPRGPEDWELLPQYFAAEKADGRARYMLHTGDLCKGSQLFDADYSSRVAALYRQSSIPTLFVVGDNEWNDQDNPDASWPIWEKDFSHFHEAYPNAPKVQRQESYPENMAWLDDGVLFIGINMVGGFMHDVEGWGYRHRANAEWVQANLDQHGADAYAVVVFAQAAPNWKHEDFTVPFAASVAEFGKPVLFIHGDHHHWEYEEGWRAPNLTRIQVDQVTLARPAHITVSPENPEHPFSFDRHGAGEEKEAMKTGFLNESISVHDVDQHYMVYVPEDYSADKAWPLIVFLHGAGERGDDGVAQSTAGIGNAIRKDPSRFPAIVLMPQCPKDRLWNTQHDVLDAQFAHIREQYNIDPGRIYLTGLSMGGYGAWLWGGIHTDTFAAIMPICGGGDPYAIQKLLNVGGGNPYGSQASRIRALATVPIWAFHGGADGVVPPQQSRDMVEAIKARGGDIQYTEYEGVGHNSWDKAYQESEGIEWLLKQRKK